MFHEEYFLGGSNVFYDISQVVILGGEPLGGYSNLVHYKIDAQEEVIRFIHYSSKILIENLSL